MLMSDGDKKTEHNDQVSGKQRPEGSVGVSHAVMREMSSKCKGPEVCLQNVKAVSAGGAEVRG